MNIFYQLGIMFGVGAAFGTLTGLALYLAQKKTDREISKKKSLLLKVTDFKVKKESKKSNEKLKDNNKNKKQDFSKDSENFEQGIKAYLKRGLLSALQEKETNTGLGQLSNALKRKISKKYFKI